MGKRPATKGRRVFGASAANRFVPQKKGDVSAVKRSLFFVTILLAVLLCAALPTYARAARQQPKAPALDGLKIEEIALNARLDPAFDPAVLEYTYQVQNDIYGVRFTPTAAEGTTITVNGTEVPSGEKHLVELPQGQEDYGKDLSMPVEIVVRSGKKATTYTVTIRRENGRYLYDQFTVGEFSDKETCARMDYLLYVPKDYDAKKTYPLVLALHGRGQNSQPVDMIAKRYEVATCWVKRGYECIVLAPHNMNLNAEDKKFGSDWAQVDEEGKLTLGEAGQVAYRLLEQIRSQYSIDPDRQYVTGLSLGGIGALAMVAEHPQDWAAALPVCATAGAFSDFAWLAERIVDHELPVWLCHAADDPVVNYNSTYQLIHELNMRGYGKMRTTVYPNNTVFWPSAHFSWTATYANPVILDWVMAQTR